jgi:hypothetical protein
MTNCFYINEGNFIIIGGFLKMAIGTSLSANRTSVFGSIRNRDNKGGSIDGKAGNNVSIFGNNKDLQAKYHKALAKGKDSEEMNLFVDDYLNNDKNDDGKINGSILNNKISKKDLNSTKKEISKNFLSESEIILILKQNDDGSGTKVFKNTELIEKLDLLDDGLKNKSVSADYYKNLITEKIHVESSTNKSKYYKDLTTPMAKDYNTHYVSSGDNTRKRLNPESLLGKGAGEKAVAIAESYLGVTDADSGRLFGESGPCCAAFVNTVWKNANNGEDPFKGIEGSHYVPDYVRWANDNGRWIDNPRTSEGIENLAKSGNLKAGDLIVFGEDEHHIGIVESVDEDGTIHTIEGNTSDKCARRSYDANSDIKGFIKMSKNEK